MVQPPDTAQLLTIPYESEQSLISSDRALLALPESRQKSNVDQDFPVKVLMIWGIIYKTKCRIHTKSVHAHKSPKLG